jgi:metal-responsive CopG/Arc/MetJ family transcriptional regulator
MRRNSQSEQKKEIVMDDRERLTISLNRNVVTQLKHAAVDERVSTSEFIQNAVQRFLKNRHGNRQKQVAADGR